MASAALAGYTERTFAHDRKTRTVFERGDGPAVMVMTEIPQITPDVLAFANRLVDAGYRVALPQFMGIPGDAPTGAHYARAVATACISREFATFVTGKTSPIVTWMRALARDLHERHGGPGIGVVGMCLTGGFALACVTEEAVVAAVGSQPSLPFGLSPAHKADLGLSPADLKKVRARLPQKAGYLAMRFTNDALCPAQRFATTREQFGDAAMVVEIDSSPGNPHNLDRHAHSVLSKEYVDDPGHPAHTAMQQVLGLFKERLTP